MFSVIAETSVAESGIFYDDAVIRQSQRTRLDENTLAPDKTPLLPGQTASFANYISYDRGINGISLYFRNLAQGPTLDNWADFFEFRVGNDNTFAAPGWTAAPEPIAIEIDSEGTVDRVNIRFEDYSIVNEWLEVTTLANEFTGLSEPDVHYWGSAVGETGDSAIDTFVNAADVSRIRNNLSGFFTVDINSPYDINRDGRVNATDVSLVRNNLSGFFSLALISPPANSGSASKDLQSDLKRTFDERFETSFENQDELQSHRVDYCLMTKVSGLRLSGSVEIAKQNREFRDRFFELENSVDEKRKQDAKQQNQSVKRFSAAENPLAIQAGIPTPR